jgi:L-aminopeptidase/D-esterase-like protein
VTVVLPELAVAAAVDVRGGAPGTINTDALRAGGLIREVHGLVLSGGSAFGLEAATGLMAWLSARGRGFTAWGPCIPVVAGAILFDMANGGDKDWGDAAPYRRLAQASADAAGREVGLGNAGAGYGAVAGQLKGGLGTASAVDGVTGVTVGALVAVNAVGSAVMPASRTMWAWHLEQAGELGGQPPPTAPTGHAFATKGGLGMNTTIGVVATDAALDHADLQRLAVMAGDGYGFAIRPIHTPLDGDAMFALATGAVALPDRSTAVLRLGAIAADVVARAVMRAVYEAGPLGDIPAYRNASSTLT